MLVVFVDIDGTIADIDTRLALAGIKPPREDRAAFQSWLERLQSDELLAADKPVPGMQDLITTLGGPDTHIVYLTGRALKYEDVTVEWLTRFQFPLAPLIMRASNDWRRAADYKEAMMKKYLKYYKHEVQVVVLDDDGDECCGEMYRKNGWTHLKAMWNKIGEKSNADTIQSKVNES